MSESQVLKSANCPFYPSNKTKYNDKDEEMQKNWNHSYLTNILSDESVIKIVDWFPLNWPICHLTSIYNLSSSDVKTDVIKVTFGGQLV